MKKNFSIFPRFSSKKAIPHKEGMTFILVLLTEFVAELSTTVKMCRCEQDKESEENLREFTKS